MGAASSSCVRSMICVPSSSLSSGRFVDVIRARAGCCSTEVAQDKSEVRGRRLFYLVLVAEGRRDARYTFEGLDRFLETAQEGREGLGHRVFCSQTRARPFG